MATSDNFEAWDKRVWTREELSELKIAYANANLIGAETFTACGCEFHCSWARYLIEYLEGRFRRRED